MEDKNQQQLEKLETNQPLNEVTNKEVETVESTMNNQNHVVNKKISPLFTVIMTVFVIFAFGLGLFFGKEIFTDKKSKNENNEQNTNIEKNNDKEDVSDIEQKDTIFNKIYDSKIEEISDKNLTIKSNYELLVNNKEIVNPYGPVGDIAFIHKVENNYLVEFHGSGINSVYLYLIDSNGEVLQKIHEIDDNNMVIAATDKYGKRNYVGNSIELYGTRLMDGPALMIDIDGKTEWLYICDQNQIAKANVYDDYPVISEYKLVYSNNKFEFVKIKDIETLGDKKNSC